MPVSYSFNPEQTRYLDRKVKRIDVSHGSLIVTETDNPVVIRKDETKTFKDVAALTAYSPEGANVAVYYFDEKDIPAADPKHLEYDVERAKQEQQKAEDQGRQTETAKAKVHQAKRTLKNAKAAVRGDSGGQTGSYESRTVKELRALAKDKGITGGSKLGKDKLIKALRA
jgi:hypothetical protein